MAVETIVRSIGEKIQMLLRPRLSPILTALLLSFSSQGSLGASGSVGDAATVALPLLAAGISLYQDDGEALWQLVKSEAAALAVTEVLKATVHEARPNRQGDKSFPSRHASVAFSAAHFMQMRGGWACGVPAYVVAVAVAADRVHLREHYTKDVIAGAAIGIASSAYFTDKPYRVSVGYLPGERALHAQFRMDW